MMTWFHRSSTHSDMPERLGRLLQYGYLNDEHPSVVVHDFDCLRIRCRYLRDVFPNGTLHTLAVKANPLLEVLRCAVEEGMGLETASSGELALAWAVDCPAQNVVFDSPAKTRRELQDATRRGVTINVNSKAELQRVVELGVPRSLGLRVNPLVADATRESTTMVATARSKFGVPLPEARRLLESYSGISGLHVHVGSQVATKEDLVEAGRRVVELAEEFPSITWLDIGGGLPTQYRAEDPGLDPRDYLESLLEVAPGLERYRLITEIGRALQANCGFAVSRVEYVTDGRLILHLGADFAVRVCYQNEAWYHDIEVFDKQGRRKTGERRKYDIFGPLCFSGDRLAQQRELPRVEEGDLIVLHDCGGYTLGMWSRYCSRLRPEVLAWENEDFRTIRKRETESEIVQFWS